MKYKLLPEEKILPDDYPVFYGYAYIGDMKFIRNNVLTEGNVGQLKKELGILEIRRCNLFSHSGAKLNDHLEK